MPAPLISIIVATRNSARTLGRCLDSIRAQVFRDFELIVMDGASADGTAEVLEKSADVVTRWRSEPDRGVYHAWNKALREVRGEWICFLGADDWLSDPRALERLTPALRAGGHGCRVVYSRVRFVDPAGSLVEEVGEAWPRARRRLLRGFCLPQPGLMHHRSLFEQYGRFDESFRVAADYEFLLRELKSQSAFYVPVLTVTMLFRGVSARPENLYQILGETRRALVLHGLRPPRLLWMYMTACAWLYLYLHRIFGDRVARRVADFYRIASLRKPRYSTPEE
jgi:glycosyltransferase involved in cell wall biosynthesis